MSSSDAAEAMEATASSKVLSSADSSQAFWAAAMSSPLARARLRTAVRASTGLVAPRTQVWSRESTMDVI